MLNDFHIHDRSSPVGRIEKLPAIRGLNFVLSESSRHVQ